MADDTTRELTVNQIVAANLIRARRLRGWTQDKAAEACRPYLGGKQWTRARWSQAERTIDGERIRPFSADEIAAFSAGFDLPAVWFLLPPRPETDKDPALPDTIRVGEQSVPLADYLDRTYIGELTPELLERVVSLSEFFGRETKEKEIARTRPMILHALADAFKGELNLIANLDTAVETLPVLVSLLRSIRGDLRDITGAYVRETMGMEHEYTDTEREQMEAGQRLRSLDRVAESIEHVPNPTITDKETSR